MPFTTSAIPKTKARIREKRSLKSISQFECRQLKGCLKFSTFNWLSKGKDYQTDCCADKMNITNECELRWVKDIYDL